MNSALSNNIRLQYTYHLSEMGRSHDTVIYYSIFRPYPRSELDDFRIYGFKVNMKKREE